MIPTQILATTIEEIRHCTTGTGSVISTGTTGDLSKDRTLVGTLITSGAQATDIMDYFADPNTAQSQML